MCWCRVLNPYWADGLGCAGERQPPSAHAALTGRLARWIAWLLGSLVVPLLRASFYCTESEAYRQQVFYYRCAGRCTIGSGASHDASHAITDEADALLRACAPISLLKTAFLLPGLARDPCCCSSLERLTTQLDIITTETLI